MKRADAQKAVDQAFLDTLSAQYRSNLFNDPFSGAATREEAFRKVLATNIAAHGIASRAIAESKGLED
jgi:hypothetical protein